MARDDNSVEVINQKVTFTKKEKEKRNTHLGKQSANKIYPFQFHVKAIIFCLVFGDGNYICFGTQLQRGPIRKYLGHAVENV